MSGDPLDTTAITPQAVTHIALYPLLVQIFEYNGSAISESGGVRWTAWSVQSYLIGMPGCASCIAACNNAHVPSPLTAPVAMAGKECVAIASDLRFGVQLQTLATDYKKVYKIHDQLFLGLSGLASDSETLYV